MSLTANLTIAWCTTFHKALEAELHHYDWCNKKGHYQAVSAVILSCNFNYFNPCHSGSQPVGRRPQRGHVIARGLQIYIALQNLLLQLVSLNPHRTKFDLKLQKM